MIWNELVEIIDSHQHFVLTSHVRPDADALGSELGLARILKQMGKEVRIANASPTPTRLAFMDSKGEISVLGQSITEAEILQAQVHIIVDTSAWGQLGDMARSFRKSTARKIVIDHHVSSDDLEALMFKDVLAEATGTLIFELLQALEQPLVEEIAEPLFCAIATDTGWFRFPSTRQHTMQVVGELIRVGVRPSAIYETLYEQFSPGRMKLAGRVLERIQVECEGKLATTYVKFDDYAETGAEPADTEDLVNECLRIKGTKSR
ncbi:MAG: DHH family phosphoesterase [Planctomycetales bacterium]